MTPPETVYRGERLEGPHGEAAGVRVTVNDSPLALPRELQVGSGMEWGYRGAGCYQTALAVLLHATGGDLGRATRSYRWFAWAVVVAWGWRWSITAGEVRRWLDQCDREPPAEEREEAEALAADPLVIGAEGGVS